MALVVAIWATRPLHDYVFNWVPDLHMNPMGALLIVLFGFLFVTVSSRLTGEIGSSSNPISGMTVATLLLTCAIFYALTWTTKDDRLAALSVAAIVCVAASNGGSHVARPEDRLPYRRDAVQAAMGHRHRQRSLRPL